MSSGITAAAALVGAVTGDHRLILNPDAPLESARELLRRQYLHELLRTLHHQAGTFFEWQGTHYAEIAEEHIRASICRFLDGAQRLSGKKLVAFDPTPRHVGDVQAMLRTEAQLALGIRAPAWMDRQPRPTAAEIFSCANGLLHLPTRTLHPHTPMFFGFNAVDYAFDPDAAAPREWLAFLSSIWPDDHEAIGALQEMFGYLLTANTTQQKAFLIVGPPRSGKGTVARVLTALLGSENVAGPTLASLPTGFGLMPLIGKPLAVISDARLGGRADQAAIAERLLSITGEDTLTVDRKYREPWTGRLPTRFLILSNELPRLADASGAFPSRLIVFRLRRSFLGQEDHGLTARLLPERPGILNWATVGLARLVARGHFVQPASARQEIEALADLASPISAFVRDCCVVGAGYQVSCDSLFHAWRAWCLQQGREHPGTAQTFGRDLHAALPAVEVSRPRGDGNARARRYGGVGLAAEAGRAADAVAGWTAPSASTG